jgi:hypothetical protein
MSHSKASLITRKPYHPSNRHKAVGFTQEQFHNAFANTLSREESDKA